MIIDEQLRNLIVWDYLFVEVEIVTSRDATLLSLSSGVWGAIAAPDDDLSDISEDFIRIGNDPYDFDCVDGFIFLSSSGWTNKQQNLLTESLLARQRPVLIANADLVAPRNNGFSLEPGYFGHLLLDNGVQDVNFFGKPFAKVYDLLEESLDLVDQDKILCVVIHFIQILLVLQHVVGKLY